MSSQNNTDNYAAICKVIGLYLQAPAEAKSDIMKPAFHKDAIMYVSDGKTISGGPIQALYDFVDSQPKAPDIKARITAIDIADNIASVRVESSNWNGASYSDMFLLLKDQDGWKILTKIYQVN